MSKQEQQQKRLQFIKKLLFAGLVGVSGYFLFTELLFPADPTMSGFVFGKKTPASELTLSNWIAYYLGLFINYSILITLFYYNTIGYEE